MNFNEYSLKIKSTALMIVLLSAILLIVIYTNPGKMEYRNVKIGIMDSGCSKNQGNYVKEYKTFTYQNYSFPSDELSVYDTIGHGTNICQIIIDETQNFEIYSAKIANAEGRITYDSIFAAIKYLAEEVTVDIINLSLGGAPYYDNELNEAFKKYADYITIIAAIGNKGSDLLSSEGVVDWPASLPWVIGVGSGNNFGRNSFSSVGQDGQGTYILEFLDNGNFGSLLGTSFSAPRVTSKIANFFGELLSLGVEPSPNELIYTSITNSEKIKFSNEIGWGVLNEPNNIKLTKGIVIAVDSYNDKFIRFPGENWKLKFKFYSYDVKISPTSFLVKGNGSDSFSGVEISQENWGGIISLNFEGGTNIGANQIIITTEFGNEIEYNFDISPASKGRILFDQSTNVNGFGHEFGDYEFVSSFLREQNFEVVHSFNGTTDYNVYDAIFVSEMGKMIVIDDRNFTREISKIKLDNYINYVKSGGNLLMFLNHPSEFAASGYNKAFLDFGFYSTRQEIPKTSVFSSVVEITNLTSPNSYNLFDNVDYISMSGSGLEILNQSNYEIAWYRDVEQLNGITIGLNFVIAGIFGKIGNGTFVAWSGSEMLKDIYFNSSDRSFNKFLINYISNFL